MRPGFQLRMAILSSFPGQRLPGYIEDYLLSASAFVRQVLDPIN